MRQIRFVGFLARVAVDDNNVEFPRVLVRFGAEGLELRKEGVAGWAILGCEENHNVRHDRLYECVLHRSDAVHGKVLRFLELRSCLLDFFAALVDLLVKRCLLQSQLVVAYFRRMLLTLLFRVRD